MPRQSHQHKPSLRKHISTAFYAAFIASVSGGFTTVYSNTAYAEAQQVFDFKLPAGKLEDALNALAKQSAITLTFDANQVKGKTVPAITQLLTREQALQLLLKDTALEAKPTNGAIIIVPRPIAAHTDTLPEVSVSASRSRTTNTLPQPFAGGQVAKASRMGILGNVDIFETPFSTQSYTEEFVLDQQARRLADIIAADPSTRSAMAEYGDSETYHIRGFPLFTNQVGINGLYGMTDLRRIAPDFYERVDVLKGPASMLNGSSPFGVTGGNINLVSKRAGDTPLNRFTASYISDSQFGGHLDLGRRFGEDNAWG
ncbi:conserved hypothetical protein, partial [Ricinus communis]